jgi:hypothetical protein
MKLSRHIHPIKQPTNYRRNGSTVYDRRQKVGVLRMVNYSRTEPERC